MTLPGPVITQSATPPPRSALSDVGVAFVVGLTEKGPAASVDIRSMADYTSLLGARVTYGSLYDWLETFFAEGGARAVVSRVLGPAALAAFNVLFDAAGSTGTDQSLLIAAESAGDWGNSLNVEVVAGDAGGEFKLVVTHDTLGLLETSPSLVDRDAAVLWSQTSPYISVALGVSAEDPRVQAAVSLAGGTDDRASITDAHWLIALNRFTKDQGAGKVLMPNRTTSTAQGQLMDHARVNNRHARVDFADTGTAATLQTAALVLRADTDARYASGYAPWVTIPGLTPGTTRLVPYSAVQCGIEARNAGLGLSVNQPAAGELGRARYALGLSQVAWSDADRELLNDAGVNVAIVLYGGVRTYGARTLVSPIGSDRDWLPVSNSILGMEIGAKANLIAEEFEFRQIDGARHTISDFGAALVGMLLPYQRDGSLYGATPDDAFIVDVGEAVNTPTTIAARELHARLGLKMSPFGERVFIDISRVPLTQALT